MIRVVIAEDQQMVLGALAALLQIEPDLEVVGQASDGSTALELVRALHPDVLLADIEMPGMSGLELAGAVQAEGARPRVIILTTFARQGYLRRALEAGASGYVLKDAPSQELAEAIRRVHAGGRAVDSSLAAEAWSEASMASGLVGSAPFHIRAMAWPVMCATAPSPLASAATSMAASAA